MQHQRVTYIYSINILMDELSLNLARTAIVIRASKHYFIYITSNHINIIKETQSVDLGMH